MPYASDRQRRKFHAMAARGEISEQTVEEYDRKSKGLTLPETAPKRKKPKRKK